MFCSAFLSLPVHAGGVLVVDLHAIHADVALAGFGVARYYTWKCDKTAGVFRPALENGKPVEGNILAANYFFARAGGDRLRKELPHFRELWEHLDFVQEALRRFYVHELADAVGYFVEFGLRARGSCGGRSRID